MKVEIDLPDLPPGYEYTGEYRQARKYDIVMDGGALREWSAGFSSATDYLIVRKRKPQRILLEEVLDPDGVTDGCLVRDSDGFTFISEGADVDPNGSFVWRIVEESGR